MTRDEVRVLRDRTEDVRQHRRWQVIWLAQDGKLRAEEIARVAGVKQSTVYQWVHRYNHQGPEGLLLKKWGGDRRRLLTDAQEREILASFALRAANGELVVIHALGAAVEACLGHTVGRGFPYRMAHRQKWRTVAPRPEHPKKNPEAQASFKKNSRM